MYTLLIGSSRKLVTDKTSYLLHVLIWSMHLYKHPPDEHCVV